MTRYLIGRVFQAVTVILGVMLIVVVLFKLQSPVALARAIIGPRASRVQIAFVIKQNGYNLPIWGLYWHVLDNYGHLYFGYSYQFNTPVRALIAEYLPKTLLLVGAATILALLVALPLGVFQAVRHNKPMDYVFTGATFVLYAMPPFVIGPLLILYFAVDRHVFTPIVPSNSTVAQLAVDWRAMTLPVVTLAALTIAAFSRYTRSSMMDVLYDDHVRTARAKGLGTRQVLVRHVLRNALLPIITLLGLSLPTIVGGAVITETVFNYPGMGYLIARAAEQSDLATVLGTTVVLAIATVIGSLAADILYAIMDPRIRYGS